jgi:hypothetical protein
MKDTFPSRSPIYTASLRRAFLVLEAIVIGMTIKDCLVRFPSMHGEHLPDWFYYSYGAMALCLAVISCYIRHSCPRLGWTGFTTLVVAGLLISCSPAVY